MNQINLIGRLTSRPELKYTSSNKAVCDFSIAVNRNYTNEDGKREADFINCQVWNKQAENLCKYQDKGNQIAVDGNLRVQSYDDKDANKRYSTFVLVNNIEYLESKKNDTKNVSNEKSKNNDKVYEDFANEIELTEADFGW